jgi:hypothetical protein
VTSTTVARGTTGIATACEEIGDSNAISMLARSLPSVVSRGRDSQAVLKKAIDALQRVARDAPVSFQSELSRATSALEAVRRAPGDPTSAQLRELAAAFTSLGREVQTQCRLPLG